jgi:hypothetical protein
MTKQVAESTTTTELTKDETAASCCGGPAAPGTGACCVKDAVAKAAGDTGCGCAPKAASPRSGCC